MSNGLNLNSILNIASIAGAAFTGGASLMLNAAMQAASQVGAQALGSAMQSLGIGAKQMDAAIDAFQAGFALATGDAQGFAQELGELASGIQSAANHQGANGEYTGDLDRAVSDLTQDITDALIDARRDARDGESAVSGSSEGKSWLVAIAEALGKAMGEHAANMVGYANDMNNATGGGDDPEAAREFASLQSKMQGEAQMFSIASSTMSTTIKAIGEGLSSVARKQ
ncbi:hypothetical protein RM530_12765 [Algiphilus sp. W345]|uniref:Uncharacterized protein n=1 Tax=Banduia mediterranea TaxID=3075609 RepID=A0ABU2WK23_9GAMM|nr:hypothetical protein [Algiphilus sp. W345]MDT0498231.1 hypothetical protein [Algiphilus sp. W345]